jgi:ATP-dependent DNA helicase RecQ
MSESKNIHEILAQNWGFSDFREKQEDIIQSVLDGQDTLALLPTGGGKSICFQVPALAQVGLCLVISPLIALMQDQVTNLQQREIKALSITSAMSKREIDIALDNAAYGNYKFLYVSPERLETELFKARIEKMNINLVAIDEAHCISQWGYDFRPSYLNIAKLREKLPKVPFLALTATATKKVVEDIQEKLEFKKKHVIQKSFERENLAYVVLKTEDQIGKMLKVIDGVKGSGIIYVNSRKKTKQIAQRLIEHKISADFYHAGLSHEDRKHKQQNWVNNRCRIIVATNAFGMGIDKPDVRFVIHLDAPESLEAYFQEAGRAGRDGRKGFGVLLVNPSMTADLKTRVEQSFPSIEKIKGCYLALSNYLQIPLNGGEKQSYSLDISEFSKRYKLDLFETYHCLHFLEKENYISLSENFSMPSRLHFILKKEDLYKFQVSHKMYDLFVKTLLRTYGGLFDDYVKINEQQIAQNGKISVNMVIDHLNRLQELEVLKYEAKSNLPKVTYTAARLDQKSLRISKKTYHDRKTTAIERLVAVINYAESKNQCRSEILLSYFGEDISHRCGVCDVCLENKKQDLTDKDFKEIETQINELIIEEGTLLKHITSKIKSHKTDQVIIVIEFLVDKGKLKVESGKVSKN